MSTVSEALDFFHVPAPFRDLIDIVSGLALIIFFQVFTKIDVLGTVRGLNLDRIEADLLFLLIGYVSGKLLFILSHVMVDLFFTIIFALSIRSFDELKDRVFSYFSNRLFGTEKRPWFYIVGPPEPTAEEMLITIKDFPSVAVEIERIDAHDRMLGEFAALSLVIAILPAQYIHFHGSHWFLIAALIFFWLSLATYRESEEKISLAYEAIKKLSRTNKPPALSSVPSEIQSSREI
jgi:hypothetical protein